jgi:gluconolactonase
MFPTLRSFRCPALTFLIGLFWIHCAHAQQNPSVVDRRSELETISTEFEMADGPSWDGSSLVIPDVKGQKLYRYIAKKGELQTLIPAAGRISASFFGHGRTFLSDNPNGQIALLDGREKVAIASFDSLNTETETKPYRPNDLVVDNAGGIYVTFTPQGKVVYVKPNGELTVAVAEVETPNGITMSPDQSTLYVSSFIPKTIWAYDITASGETSGGRQIAAMDDGDGRGADGMAVDRAGNIYCAGPTDIWIWSPSGKLIDKIACPSKPINCTFGDQDMRSLYITGPGALYRQRMKVSGRSPTPPSLDLRPLAKNQPEKNASIPDTRFPNDVSVELDVVYGQYGERKLLVDIMVPKTAGLDQKLPGLVIVHGGGWHNGDKTKFRALSTRMASRGYVVAAIEYRLADEAAFPAAIHDCTAAVRFLRANADKYHIQADKIGAIGGSAGAHLTGLMASGGGNPQLKGEGGNADRSSRIQASIVMAGPLEMLTGSVAERSRSGKVFSNSNSWLRGTVDEKPDLYRLADAYAQIDEDTCPILFMVGEHDHPERNQRSRDKLKSLGIDTGIKVYKDGKHGCWNRLPWLDEMVVDMDAFMSEHLK